MRSKYILITVVLLALSFGMGRLSAAPGTVDSPALPENTQSYTLEDIYDRLDTGAAGAQSTFTEPGAGPGTGTMHTLNEIMAKAPAADNTDGAVPAEVLTGKTYWSLRTDGSGGSSWGLETGTANVCISPGPVPKTGQTACYKSDGTTGTCTCGTANCPSDQDGDLEKGVSWPTPRFITSTTGIVTDTLTGLMWMQDANAGNDCDGADTGAETWANALNSAAACNAGAGFAGYTDWRLPNVRELQSLSHYGFNDPAVPNTAGTGQLPGTSPNFGNGDPFNNVQSGRYWSSTTCAGAYTAYAYRVSMKSGTTNAFKKTLVYYVWPVRGGQ